MAVVAAGWVQGGWIYSNDPQQSGKYWIRDGWVWGPVGAADVNTPYWVTDGWIWGPRGAANVSTGFHIWDGYIYGPGLKLPFVK
ncbi:MAG TPA: hypothetical protein VL460_11795 [Caulobacteraceae bacterium]|jgi:hypothetical protein|nr:hypothetical protein [Caulobacteraceae bacterium]